MAGNGLFLLGMARRRKDLNFLGLEINRKVNVIYFLSRFSLSSTPPPPGPHSLASLLQFLTSFVYKFFSLSGAVWILFNNMAFIMGTVVAFPVLHKFMIDDKNMFVKTNFPLKLTFLFELAFTPALSEPSG